MIDLARGSAVTLRWRKWNGSPHWFEPLVFLGTDDAGTWFGQRAGTVSVRPGRSFTADVASVRVVPPRRRPGDWIATFHAAGHHDRVLVYTDLASDLRWNAAESELTAIDMDLDVVKADDERGVWIDDADEFAEHRALFGYPEAVTAAIEATATELLAAMHRGSAPFDGRADRWLAHLDRLGTP